MEYKVKILKTKFVTHDVKCFVVQKPVGYNFIPGQATDLTINLKNYKNKRRPFTFTSSNSDQNLEFIIKIYENHNGVTKKLKDLKNKDELIITDPFGAIQYKSSGVFIAGGAGITPFIAILRQLNKENRLKECSLIFSNKTEKDIILKEEFDSMEDLKKIYILTQEFKPEYENRRINEEFLKDHISNFKQYFYICGPITFVGEIQHILQKLGANTDSIVLES